MLKSVFPLLLLFFGLSTAVNAQNEDCPHFDRLVRKADTYWKNGKFEKALNTLAAAREHCPGKRDSVDRKSLTFTNEITLKYREAERNAALARTKELEATQLTAQLRDMVDEIERQREVAIDALNNLEIIADQAVPIVLADIDRDIYRLEYDSTYEKCKTAVGLNARRPEVEKRIWEIAWFYTEADTGAAAVAFLNLLKPTGLTAETPGLQQKLREYLKKTVPAAYLDFLNKRYYPDTVLVEGGSFWQRPFNPFTGEESEDSTFIRVDSFYIGRTEITYWQYNVFARAKKHHIEPPSWEFCGDNPAVFVNWYDAAFYCNWLSERHGKNTVYTLTNPQQGLYSYIIDYDVAIDATANGYRLPTEAEWEFAARGGNLSEGFEYSGHSIPDSVAWYSENSKNRTHPVGELKKNELGLSDMSGNVWEWCQDEAGSRRVVRGGSWFYDAGFARVTARNFWGPSRRRGDLGFRLARAVNF